MFESSRGEMAAGSVPTGGIQDGKGTGNMEIRAASEADIVRLRAIAHDSEAHWGYGHGFMEKFDQVFNITSSFLLNNPVYVGQINGTIVAFWGIKTDGQGASAKLEYLYVSARHLGEGIGTYMWRDLTLWCKAHHIEKLTFVTSGQAVRFYEKMGARLCGETCSKIDGRPIPCLVFSVNGQPPAEEA